MRASLCNSQRERKTDGDKEKRREKKANMKQRIHFQRLNSIGLYTCIYICTYVYIYTCIYIYIQKKMRKINECMLARSLTHMEHRVRVWTVEGPPQLDKSVRSSM